ncbi:MAG: GxxExxY protein [Gemmataceae bacterium]|nr:GxxExxY protein [Gemmataceae bacterium]
MELQHKDITEAVIGAAFEVHNHLGYGFLEAVYKRAMKVELECVGSRPRRSPKSAFTTSAWRSASSRPTSWSTGA